MFKRFSVGFAVGYVLGAREGRERYEEITALGERALEVPWVNHVAGAVVDLVKTANAHRSEGKGRNRDRGPDGSADREDDLHEEHDEEHDEAGNGGGTHERGNGSQGTERILAIARAARARGRAS